MRPDDHLAISHHRHHNGGGLMADGTHCYRALVRLFDPDRGPQREPDDRQRRKDRRRLAVLERRMSEITDRLERIDRCLGDDGDAA